MEMLRGNTGANRPAICAARTAVSTVTLCEAHCGIRMNAHTVTHFNCMQAAALHMMLMLFFLGVLLGGIGVDMSASRAGRLRGLGVD